MDGVPDLTQEAVPPGGSFTYDFTVPDAGTFWYHPHTRVWEQMARGLYGSLIVEERDAVPFDRDLTLLIDDWRLDEDKQVHEESFGRIGEWAHGGRYGNWPTVNGHHRPNFDVGAGERIRLRLINTCNARILALRLNSDRDVSVIAIDGQPVSPYDAGRQTILLAPAQRVDVALEESPLGETAAFLEEISQDFPVRLAGFTNSVISSTPRAKSNAFSSLPSNPLSTRLDLSDAREMELTMEGGAMGRMRSAMFNGREMDIDKLVDAGKVWALNGTVGMTDKPFFQVPKGRTVVVNIVNNTAFEHPMHIHGHHFKVLSRNGNGVSHAPWRDTQLIDRGEKATVAFVADNPGKWAFHCHTLEHAAGGMITWFEVSA